MKQPAPKPPWLRATDKPAAAMEDCRVGRVRHEMFEEVARSQSLQRCGEFDRQVKFPGPKKGGISSLKVASSCACSVASLRLLPDHYLPGHPNLHCKVLAHHHFD